MTHDTYLTPEWKSAALELSTRELDDCEAQYAELGEEAWKPSHIQDYEEWKRTNKRNKR